MKTALTLNTSHRNADPRPFEGGEQCCALGPIRAMTEYNGAIAVRVLTSFMISRWRN